MISCVLINLRFAVFPTSCHALFSALFAKKSRIGHTLRHKLICPAFRPIYMWVAPSFTSASIQIHAAQCLWHLCWAIFVWSCVQSCGVDLMLNPHVHWLNMSHVHCFKSPISLPSGKRLHRELEHHYFQWVNPLFLWPFSIPRIDLHGFLISTACWGATILSQTKVCLQRAEGPWNGPWKYNPFSHLLVAS